MSAIVPASTTRPRESISTWVQICSTSGSWCAEISTAVPSRRGVAREIADEPCVERVESRERFVEHQQLGVADECRGDLDLLLLSLRQLLDAAARRVRQLHAVEPAGHLGGGMGGAQPLQPARGRSTCRGPSAADRARVPPAGSRSRARAFPLRRRRRCVRPSTIRTSVVFPAPFGPTRPDRSPPQTSSDTSSRTCAPPSRLATADTRNMTDPINPPDRRAAVAQACRRNARGRLRRTDLARDTRAGRVGAGELDWGKELNGCAGIETRQRGRCTL